MRTPALGTSSRALALALIAAWPALAQYPCPVQWVGLSGANGPVHALITYDDGTGPALYAGGEFTSIGGVTATGIAKWNGAAWSHVGGGLASVGSYLPASARALAVYDDGTGPALYAAGRFTHAGGVPALRVARWNGSQWSALLTGFDNGQGGANSAVEALAVHDDGTGPQLYAGGDFVSAGGLYTDHVARWNGAWWTPIGTGIGDVIHAYVPFDDGTGPALYAGGQIQPVVKWNGSSWVSVGPAGFGMQAPPGTTPVTALAAADLGQGPRLFAGGNFTAAYGNPASRVAVWNGASWQALGAGLNGTVLSLAAWNDGVQTQLYAAGSFTASGPTACAGIARWNGAAWAPVGSGLGGGSDYGDALLATPNSLVLGGSFATVGGVASPDVAEWRAPGPALTMVQTGGPGSGTLIQVTALAPGHEYYDVFSVSPCPGGPGTGPYAGLCFTDPSLLSWQISLPVGTAPIHFAATGAAITFGPYSLPPAFALEALTGDVTGGVISCVSSVTAFTPQ